ncbi:MAG: PrsW family glutamic-type intramembrane protease [Acidimicrobiales bacterium]
MAVLDRVEPEPRPALIHAFLWGATVDGDRRRRRQHHRRHRGGEVLAAVVSAPLVEEAMKACGIIGRPTAVEIDECHGRHRRVAELITLGFAEIEDISYFAQSPDGGVLARPSCCAPSSARTASPTRRRHGMDGLAIGRAARRKPVFPNAVSTMSPRWPPLWNGSLASLRRRVTSATVLRRSLTAIEWCSCCCSSPR